MVQKTWMKNWQGTYSEVKHQKVIARSHRSSFPHINGYKKKNPHESLKNRLKLYSWMNISSFFILYNVTMSYRSSPVKEELNGDRYRNWLTPSAVSKRLSKRWLTSLRWNFTRNRILCKRYVTFRNKKLSVLLNECELFFKQRYRVLTKKFFFPLLINFLCIVCNNMGFTRILNLRENF